MRVSLPTSLLVGTALAWLGCGVVEAFEHEHQHEHGGHEGQVPLREQGFTQDSKEELERKWSFEVSLLVGFGAGGED